MSIHFCFGQLIGTKKCSHTGQHGRLLTVLCTTESGGSRPSRSLTWCRSQSGHCSINLATAPTAWPLLLYLITQTWPRPQACCPSATLAPGKVEAEGTLAKSAPMIISPRLSTVTPRYPLRLSSLFPEVGFFVFKWGGHFGCSATSVTKTNTRYPSRTDDQNGGNMQKRSDNSAHDQL